MATGHVQNRAILAGLSNARKGWQKLIEWFSGGVSTGPAGSVTKVELGTNLTGTQVGDTLTIAASGGGGSGVVETIVPGTGISVDSTDPANPIVSATSSGSGEGTIYAEFDATPAELETAYSRPITVPFDWTITGWRILGALAETGNATFDVLIRSTIAGSDTSIVGTTPPSVTGANAAEGSDMTGWTTTGSAGEMIVFHLTSPAAFHALRVELQVTKA